MTEKPNWKTLTFIIGGTVGLLSGLAAAYLIIKRREEGGDFIKFSSGDGARIGMGIVSLLRTVSETGRK